LHRDVGRLQVIFAMLHRAVPLAVGNALAQAAKRVTSVVPIVMAATGSPVEAGLVASLARPGGNITGFTTDAGSEIDAKRLQMLKEALPEVIRIAYLGVKNDWDGPQGTSVRAAARLLAVTLVHAVHTPTHYADAFALVARLENRGTRGTRFPSVNALSESIDQAWELTSMTSSRAARRRRSLMPTFLWNTLAALGEMRSLPA
jgi:hypothetical protein